MDYELKKFKRDKSSIIPIEEVFTDLDIKADDPCDPSIGYRFDTPRKWAQDRSINKSVGIRDLKLTPSSGDIHCRFLHFLNPCVEAYPAAWNIDHYDIDTVNKTYIQVGSPTLYVSLTIHENITPNNEFEAVITDILFNQLPTSIWRQVFTIRDTKKAMYVQRTYAPSHEHPRALYYTDADVTTQVKNNKLLPIPSTFRYNYDSDTSQFNVTTNKDMRKIIMKDMVVPTGIDGDPLVSFSNAAYGVYETVQTATTETSGLTTVYDQHPFPANSELLMITRDEASLRSIYALFNQHMPQKPVLDSNSKIVGYEDDFSVIATITVDNVKYYVPFIHKQTGGGYVTIQGNPYTSYFCLDGNAAGRTANITTHTDINNLSLSNVWDRLRLIFHASFAETRTRMIGRNNDHWDSPNKRFIVPGGDQDQFYLRFTTDGKHNILPIGCHFNVDLCFMLNTTNNTATGNRDTFK